MYVKVSERFAAVIARVTFVAALLALATVANAARADTLEAPVGGKGIALGDGRVFCAAGAGWVVEPGGRTVRPPTAPSAVGMAIEAKVAASAPECARSTATVKLVTTGPWPTIDPARTTLALDEGRLEMHGRGLRGAQVAWVASSGASTDACRDPKRDPGGSESCSWGVPKTTSADPTSSGLRWLPAGALNAHDAALFDAGGRRAPAETFAIAPSRVEISKLLPADASVDVSSGVGLVPIVHPEAVASVDCGPQLRCTLDGGVLSVQPPPASVTSIDVKFRLIAHVFFTRTSPPETAPVVRVAVLRCPMTVASGPILRNTDTARAVVRVEGACARDIASLRFHVGSRRVDVVQTDTAGAKAYAVLAVGNVDTPNSSITATRAEPDSAIVAVARTTTAPPPKIRTVVEITPYPPIDFIPNNRPAIVHLPRVKGAKLTLLPVENVYETAEHHGVTTVKADVTAAGYVAFQIGYRDPALPTPLDRVDLAVLTDPLQRAIKEADVPAPFAPTANGPAALVELVCTRSNGTTERITPGKVTHVPYDRREGCRVIVHTERLSAELGSQKVNLEIEVDTLDGASRGEAHVNQPMVLRHSAEPRVAWIKGVKAEYDKAIVRFSMVADEHHYLGAQELVTAAPTLQWSVIFGTGHLRLYATSAIPTGLYRFGDSQNSGPLALSFGVLSRLTWLDSTGHEGLLGLEAGVMVFGITTTDVSTTGVPLTQVGFVAGIGLSIPLANAGGIAQASFNLHLWFEQRITGTNDVGSSDQALIFGPSISFGNLGASF